MLKYRPTGSFGFWMLVLCPLVGGLYFGLLPELEAIASPRIPGDIAFTTPRPAPVDSSPSPVPRPRASSRVSEWFSGRLDDLMTWEHNPWKIKKSSFGNHYFELLASKDPKDRARAMELRRLAEALYQRVLERYPELAVTLKNVPPGRNGFLKWLEFAERFDADPSRPGHPRNKGLDFPDEIKKHLGDNGPWDAAAAKAWLTKEKTLLDEIRAVGLLPDQSVKGIGTDRWAFLPARLAKGCAEALLLDARLAAEEGNVEGALASVHAASGLAAHFGNVETPTLLAVTVQILIQLQVQNYAMSHVLPALPAGQFDPAAWEQAVNPQVHPPAEFARIMKGEWNVSAREYLLPMLSDTADPKYPADPEALIDYHAGGFLEVIGDHDSPSPADWNTVPPPGFSGNSHLSRDSRELTEMLFVGTQAWSKGMIRAQNQSAMTRAAFAIMNGQPVPSDPIHGLPYRWNPATRELSPPDDPVFAELDLKPVIVPAP